MFKFLFIMTLSAMTTIAIIQVLKNHRFNRNWSYPLLLVSFPLFYMLFALWVNDKTLLKNEFFAGFLFFAIAAIYLRYRKPWVEVLLICGFFLHAVYDITHDMFFLNFGAPMGWPVFCGTVNLFIACYLWFLLKKKSRTYIAR